MQLKRIRPIRSAVTALTAALVGVPLSHSAGANRSETTLLLYSEKNRTRATEIDFSLQRDMKNKFTLDLRLTYDGLTGATPTGRSPSKTAQTVTRASGGKTVVVPAGEFPVDEAFKDRRFAAEFGLSRPVATFTNGNVGLQYSSEYDYKSVGLSAGLVQDFPVTKTSIGVAFAYIKDAIKPVGGYHEPFSPLENDDDDEHDFDARSKKSVDAVLSLTQTLGDRTIVRVSLSYDKATGYLTDPYKIISYVQPAGAEDPGEPTDDIYEKRPDIRTKYAVYSELRRHMLGTAMGLSYRYFWDDWGVRSHSVDFNFRVDLKSTGAFQPRVRAYRQSKADFHRVFLLEGAPLPEYASADSRLAAFDALTCGLTYSVPVNPSSRVNLTAEYYTQRGDRSPPESFSATQTLELFPELHAWMFRLGYAHDF